MQRTWNKLHKECVSAFFLYTYPKVLRRYIRPTVLWKKKKKRFTLAVHSPKKATFKNKWQGCMQRGTAGQERVCAWSSMYQHPIITIEGAQLRSTQAKVEYKTINTGRRLTSRSWGLKSSCQDTVALWDKDTSVFYWQNRNQRTPGWAECDKISTKSKKESFFRCLFHVWGV